MAAFTTRVVLIDGEWDDYDRLYVEMAKQGFTKTIIGDSGTEYDLPPAEYNYIGTIDRSDVLKKAKTAASTTGLDFSVLVTESVGRTWHNLDQA